VLLPPELPPCDVLAAPELLPLAPPDAPAVPLEPPAVLEAVLELLFAPVVAPTPVQRQRAERLHVTDYGTR
jgi:hypothetical protein